MKNSEKILEFLADRHATVNDITEYLGVSRQAVHRILNNLLAENKIIKSGKPPKVYYSIFQTKKKDNKKTEAGIGKEAKKAIDEEFLYVTPSGQKLNGWNGFVEWCVDRKQDAVKMSGIYLKTIKKYDRHRENGLINGMAKMRSTFKDVALDEVYYLDFYSIEIFGKTKLGQTLLFAKQSQDRVLMNEMIDSIRPSVAKLIKRFKIDGIVYIPPTVKREHQLMKQLERRLTLDIRKVKTVKLKTPIIVPQKTLGKLDDRIINARETIIVDDSGSYNNILLLDDAVGSGATLNETAKKIRNRGLCKGKIIGLAITGSAKGFDVISEV